MMTPRLLLLILTCLAGFVGASAQVVVQTNYVVDGTTPGPYGLSNTDLLQTNLGAVSRTGSAGFGDLYFYREDSGYAVDLARLVDGSFGGSYSSNESVMPNQVTITFDLDLSTNTDGYNLSSIRTYASWDDGRDGQAYTVQFSQTAAPATYYDLITISQFNSTDGFNDSNTLVELTGVGGVDLVTGVASVRFVFTGFENGGTAYREFDILGSITAVPEPSTYVLLFVGGVTLGIGALRRRRANPQLP